jgi:hypothetical protein
MIICKEFAETMFLYRVAFLTGLFSRFLFDTFFFFLAIFLLPGGELGGRIDTPGSVIGVIPNAIISSIFSHDDII